LAAANIFLKKSEKVCRTFGRRKFGSFAVPLTAFAAE
jgi:hypothetical protein